MTDYIVTEIKPFVYHPDDFISDDDKEKAEDLKEFPNKNLTFMDSVADMNTRLCEGCFYVDSHGLKKYYKFSPNSPIS